MLGNENRLVSKSYGYCYYGVYSLVEEINNNFLFELREIKS